MAKYTPGQTTKWVVGKLKEAQGVVKVEVVSDQVLRVAREKYDPFLAGIVSATCVDVTTIKTLVQSKLGVEIIANVPKESYWTGEAIRLAEAKNIATGAYGDLLRVIGVEDVRTFKPRETTFIERGLEQHTRISSFERVHDRLYRISRNGLPDLMVVMLAAYELTADHLRTARSRYGQFSVAVNTDPNGDATGSAEQAAEAMSVEILKWGAFLGRLNRK
jgi:hypothetical protein